MATAPPRNQNTSLPPRRGRVKAQIFGSLAGNLSSVASKASQMLAKIKGGTAAANTSPSASASASASTTPPPSAYASDGYPEQA